ncbi:alpha/beta hydrolase [Rhodococcus sp. 14C212]|uniref:alpha/beta fold hydrolase n=1 Tax=Rhodococcus sp. 14C212 TaxID=2711209 RepID=UPI0013EC2E69|nr:alpha/beta hydrolase [Rhodococcus sp. 14C212]
MGAHVVLVPGFWLGAWAWEGVAEDLRARGHRVDALTLPGLGSVRTDRSGVTLDDHVGAVVDAVAGGAILVAHSGAGPVAYAASDRVPRDVACLVYVDSGPLPHGTALRPDLDASEVEVPLPPWAELEADGNSLQGLDEPVLRRFRERAVPHPAGPARTPLALRDDARLAVPTTVVCSSFPSGAVPRMTRSGHPVASELGRLTDVEYVDLPTGHWPMWSRPADLAAAIDAAAIDTAGRH